MAIEHGMDRAFGGDAHIAGEAPDELILALIFSVVAVAGVAAEVAVQACTLCDLRLTTSDDTDYRRAELGGGVVRGNSLITISNEGRGPDKREFLLQVLTGSPEQGYGQPRDVLLFKAPKGCRDADFEALARDGDTFYAITSHSQNRPKQKPKASYAQNRKRLTGAAIETCEARHKLMKFRLTDGGQVELLQEASLRHLIAKHPVLAPFSSLPNKENGMDIGGFRHRWHSAILDHEATASQTSCESSQAGSCRARGVAELVPGAQEPRRSADAVGRARL
jgi:Protein of unknown function (DUF3616)